MLYLSGREELLHKKAISLISQSGMTSDPEERMRLLEEASKVLEHIKEETRNGGKYGNPE